MSVFKKLEHIAFFLIGIVVVFILIMTRQHFTLLPAHGSTGNNVIVYDDQLASGFSNWSWSSSVDFTNTNPVFSGSTSIHFTPSAWGGLYFHSTTPLDSTQYSGLQFAMQTTDSPSNLIILFYGANNQIIKSLPLSQYPGSNQSGWTVYSIPLTSIGASITGVAIQESSGNAGSSIYLDAVQFVANQTTQQSGATPTQTGQSYTLYNDSLTSGWMNWSWGSSINVSSTSPVYQGSDAISYTPTAGYGGLYLHTDAGVDTTPYQFLTFVVKASQIGEAFAVAAYDNTNQQLHSPVSLANYGGQPNPNAWTTYTIPLGDLHADGKIMKGVVMQDITGHSQPAVYIDQIALISSQSTTQAAVAVPTMSLSVVPTVVPTTSPVQITASSNPFLGMTLFNDTVNDPATQQKQQWQSSNPTDATTIAKIASQPKAIWIGDWSNVQSDVQSVMSRAQSAHALPVFVAYNIPQRDCGSYSSGGASSAQAYKSWIDGFTNGIGNGRAVVILEPDALAQISCLSSSDQQQRLFLLTYAVQKFKSLGQTTVYLDAGNSNWIGATTMAGLLKTADIAQADGFALNVSNFYSDSASLSFGQQVSAQIQNKHFVVDTSRNGNGPTSDNQWCNPSGRALGDKPTTQTGNSLVDAYLWIKYPGESDGTCNGGPAAGVWYPSYALGLAQNAKW